MSNRMIHIMKAQIKVFISKIPNKEMTSQAMKWWQWCGPIRQKIYVWSNFMNSFVCGIPLQVTAVVNACSTLYKKLCVIPLFITTRQLKVKNFSVQN